MHDAAVAPAATSVQVALAKLASSELRANATVPVGALASAGSGAVSVTVTVQVAELWMLTGFGAHDTAVVVVLPVVRDTASRTRP